MYIDFILVIVKKLKKICHCKWILPNAMNISYNASYSLFSGNITLVPCPNYLTASFTATIMHSCVFKAIAK